MLMTMDSRLRRTHGRIRTSPRSQPTRVRAQFFCVVSRLDLTRSSVDSEMSRAEGTIVLESAERFHAQS